MLDLHIFWFECFTKPHNIVRKTDFPDLDTFLLMFLHLPHTNFFQLATTVSVYIIHATKYVLNILLIYNPTGP